MEKAAFHRTQFGRWLGFYFFSSLSSCKPSLGELILDLGMPTLLGMYGRSRWLGPSKASSPLFPTPAAGRLNELRFLNDGLCLGDMGKEDCACCAPRYFTPAGLLAFILDLNKLIYCLPSGSNQVLSLIVFSTCGSPASPPSLRLLE